MKILIIRHGEPDYDIDSLTEKGWHEAHLLADRLATMHIDHFYVSPLGRAQDTARETLTRLNREAQTLDWLQEFRGTVIDPKTGIRSYGWDFVPQYWTRCPELYDMEGWKQNALVSTGGVGANLRGDCPRPERAAFTIWVSQVRSALHHRTEFRCCDSALLSLWYRHEYVVVPAAHSVPPSPARLHNGTILHHDPRNRGTCEGRSVVQVHRAWRHIAFVCGR